MFKQIRLLKDRNIKENEFWIYSAGFNLEKKFNNHIRIQEEIYDLKLLLKKNCRIFILTHQGDYKKKTSTNLSFLVKILEKKIKKKFFYYSGKIIKKNLLKLKKKIKPGQVYIVGNTRLQKGEQNNSEVLARTYSVLAKKIVIGGFCKAHRKNSSNNAILNYTKGYLSNGIYKEILNLKQWSKNYKNNYLFFIGGSKKEKVEIGLKVLGKYYKYIVPSGLVLNTILKMKKIEIGQSHYFYDKKILSLVKTFLKRFSHKIILPTKLITFIVSRSKIIKKYKDLNSLQKKDIIGGFLVSNELKKIMSQSRKVNKILISGTPSFITKKILEPTLSLSKFLKKTKSKFLILGGDTSNDLALKKNISSGGGSALKYLAYKELDIIKKLNKN